MARHDVQVRVEDVLPGRAAVRLQDGHPGGREAVAQQVGDAVGGHRERRRCVLVHREGVGDVRARDDQRVAARGRRDVAESEADGVLVHPPRRCRAGDDRAEHAVVHVPRFGSWT